MQCDCIEKINAQLEEKKPGHAIELSTGINMETGETSMALPIYTTRYTKAGNPKRGVPIYVSYCPFCGTKWEKEKQPA